MEVLNNIFNSLNTYFDSLATLGYRKQSDVNSLLVYNFIGEMLTKDMRYLITEQDYKTIEQALSCLYGSNCLIPYPQYVNDDYLFGHIGGGGLIIPRITEQSNIVRFTEDDKIRFKAANYNE